MFLGDEFLHQVKVWPYRLSGWPRKLSHSIWDGGIFMVGIFFHYNKKPPLKSRGFFMNYIYYAPGGVIFSTLYNSRLTTWSAIASATVEFGLLRTLDIF